MTVEQELTIIRSSPQRLTSDAFQPYGSVLTAEARLILELDEGQVTMSLETVKQARSGEYVTELASHFSYSQMFIPMVGSLGLIVAPPPSEQGGGVVDYDRLAAFSVEVGQIVMIARGTLHWGVGLGDDATFATVKRTDAGEAVDTELNDRLYVSHIDIAGRDHRAISVSG